MSALAENPAGGFDRAFDRVAPLRWTAAGVRLLGITGRGVVIAVPTISLIVFFLVPFFVVAKISLSEAALARRPTCRSSSEPRTARSPSR